MLPLTTILARLAWAAFLGAILGLERNFHRRPAGMRTSFSVCLAAALFTIISVELGRATGDSGTTRIASNIVQGVGFLGAGAIIRDRGHITGLTTAAAIFVAAAIGMASGAGYFWIAGIACALLLFALVGLSYVEIYFDIKTRGMHFRVESSHATDILGDTHKIFSQIRVPLDDLRVSTLGDHHTIEFDANLSHKQQERVFASLCKRGVNCEMKPSERSAE
jgi:putative Mg2+ transporter-C (MgtC) family protein